MKKSLILSLSLALGVLSFAACGGDDPATVEGKCNDGDINLGEVCDGSKFGGVSCANSGYVGGSLSCISDCRAIDTSGCTLCGNNFTDTGEVCDGIDMGIASCESQGFIDGTLSCSADCKTYDTTLCQAADPGDCGNSVLDTGEICDGTLLGGVDCTTFGYISGPIACSSTCQSFDTNGCVSPTELCGNSAIDSNEVCDGSLIGSATCVSLGFSSGDVSCSDDCKSFNVSACFVPAAWTCTDSLFGSGVCDCGCGIADPDCDGAGCTTAGCTQDACVACWTSSTSSTPCSGVSVWSCDPSFNGAGDGCDCGCTVPDPDCGGLGCSTPGCIDTDCGYCWDTGGENLCP